MTCGVVSAFGAAYVLVAAVDILAFSSTLSAGVAAAVALSLLALRFLLDWGGLGDSQIESRVAVVAALLLLNGVFHLYFVPSPWQVVHMVPPVLGAGWFMLSTRALALVLVGSLTIWGAAAGYLLPRNEWIVTTLVLWAAAVVAVVNRRMQSAALVESEQSPEQPNDGNDLLVADLEAVPVSLAVLNEAGNIVASNKRWRDSARWHAFLSSGENARPNYLQRLSQAAAGGSEDARKIVSGIWRLSTGEEREFRHGYFFAGRHLRVHGSLLPGAERRRILLACEDVTAIEQAEEKVQQFERRYAAAFRMANEGLWDWNLETKEIRLSPRWKKMLGFKEDEAGNSPEEWLAKIHARDARGLLAKLSNHLDGRGEKFEGRHRMRHADGSYRWVQTCGVAIRDREGKAVRIIGSQVDVTDQKRAQDLKHQEEMYDLLTGLPNRSHFRQQLKRVAEDTGSKTNLFYALLYLDVDRFQVINDSLGHTAGDHLLVGISDRIKKCLRPGDSVARLGGDEFAVLLENLDSASQATEIANRIQAEVAQPFSAGGREVYTAVSVGITMGSYGQETAGKLLRDADTAKNRAKTLGRARCELFSQTMHDDVLGLLSIETALQRALERNEFILHYQPVISAPTGRITSCEALIRWNHPEKGMVSPKDFIPVAEQSGLIKDISEWTLRTACNQAKQWQRLSLPNIRVSVNISPQLLRIGGLAEMVLKSLEEAEVGPMLLQLELTESILMESEPATIQPLVELSARGVQIALDDFGTGYSSLGYLQRVPINALKIDESFIRHVAVNPGDAAIASGLITLAHNLNLRVTMEGVETQDQFDFCIEKECEEAQGLFINPPVDAETFTSLLESEEKKPAALLAKAAPA